MISETQVSPHLKRFAEVLSPLHVLQIVGAPGVHERFERTRGSKGYLVSASMVLGLF